MELKTNLKNDESLDLNGVFRLEIDESRNGNLNLTTIGNHPKVVLEFQNAEEILITKEEFIQEQNEDEIFSLIESFLNRWKDKFIIESKKDYPNKERALNHLYMFLPTDKQKGVIIQEMIKDFK